MDPLSQGVLAASLAQTAAQRNQLVTASVLGFLAGMAPDLDILIRSSSDPLLFLEYHRQFTHSLVFVPIGGLVCGLILHYLFAKRRGLSLYASVGFCTLGYATHALLDACTSYGTQLFWPFSHARIAWHTVSIIDPLFTLPLLLLISLAGFQTRRRYAALALIWAISYQGIGLWQRERALDSGYSIAAQRGHQPQRLEAKPTFANLLVWKIIYETDQHFYVDAVRLGVTKQLFAGTSIEKLDLPKDFPWLAKDSQQARDVERFRWFSNGYIARDPDNSQRIIDIRYAISPNAINALWSIELNQARTDEQHVQYHTHRQLKEGELSLGELLFD